MPRFDEATAAAEAMMMCHRLQHEEGREIFFVSQDCHPQIIEVVRTRAQALGLGSWSAATVHSTSTEEFSAR